MARIEQTYTIKAPAAKVWQALIDPKVIDTWGGGPAIMDDQISTEFSLWGGDVHGKNTEVVAEKLLVQDWDDGRLPHASKVRFELSEKNGVTTLHLVQADIPDGRFDDLDDGWHDYYLGPLKELLER